MSRRFQRLRPALCKREMNMPRIALKLVLGSAFLSIVACNDTQPVALLPGGASATVVTPSGTLDQNITSLLGLFNGNGALAQWKNVKRKYADGQSDPQQLAVCKTMLVNLVDWVNKHSSDMSTPPGGETKQSAAARVILYMSEYVYNGPTFTPPAYTPAADVAVGIVSPGSGDTVVTPNQTAGIGLEAGSVAEPTIIVVSENPTPYPANCSGPLQTKLCQYPRFYTFDQFPHVRLLKQAKISVCHLTGETGRTPLADHNRFRLAHTLPANAADYTPGGTVRNSGGEAVEILPLVTQTFVNCGETQFSSNTTRRGVLGGMTRLAKGIAKFFAPQTAYAIDQGFGGGTFEFSDFNDVDPDGVPDRGVESFTPGVSETHPGDHITVTYSVKNTGTATAQPTTAAIRLSDDTALTATDPSLLAVNIPALVPGQSTGPVTVSVVIPTPPVVQPGHKIGLVVDDEASMPESNLANNSFGTAIDIVESFDNVSATVMVGETSVCALNSGTTYCWGQNNLRQLGTTAFSPANSALPINPGLPTFVALSNGTGWHNCGIATGGAARCWGRHDFGSLGVGLPITPSVVPTAMAGGIIWASIHLGDLSGCGVSTTSVGYCWGSNQRGEIGDPSIPMGTSSSTMTPTPHAVTGGHQWKVVVAGWLHACGITTSGATYCWGDNSSGQLGIGSPDNTPHQSPTLVAGGHQFIQLSLGSRNTCGITVSHDAYCWGANPLGQVGDGTSGTPRGTPTAVLGGLHFSFIAVGDGYGRGTTVPLPPVVQGGASHACALTETGHPYCWGWNGSGELGDGTTIDRFSPTPVSGSLVLTNIGVGNAFTCGRRLNQVWCWGANANGQLGNGTFASATVPALVASPFDLP